MNIFKYESKTYFSAVVALLGFLALQFGIATEGEWSQLVALLAQVGGIIGIMIDRFSKGNINLLGIRK